MNTVRLDDAREQLLQVPGGRIHAVELGEGPLVVLIHGFPEGWWSWRHQLPALALAGFRAVAIDVRGYGASSHPTDVEAYRMLATARCREQRSWAVGLAVTIGGPIRGGG